MKSAIIREEFIKFYEKRGHQAVKSVPIVNYDDPTLMFVNAGMNPFKGILLGNQEAYHRRVVNSQPCLRVSGKHNDLEDVGLDTYHHTLFEMLGIWSFGDYFKEKAITWAWELLTELYALPHNRIYATVFEGSPEEGVPKDDDSYQIWRRYLPEDHILIAKKQDNFWEMGSQGPCGPSTEVHVDLRNHAERKASPGANWVNKNHPEVVEVGNWVFVQYNRLANQHLNPLPEQHVDTGIGFERLCMALQGTTSTYDTDLFTPLFQWIEKESGFCYGKNKERDIAMRVIVDHIRALHFSIAEGAMPSSQKTGYVVRRMLRRAMRYAYSFLNLRDPFLHEMIPVLAHHMGNYYNLLREQASLVQKSIHQEELHFLRTLSKGIKHFTHLTAQLEKQAPMLPGAAVFELYDTYGFPHDLTALLAREQGYTIDEDGFKKAMKQQQIRSKQAAQQDLGDWQVITTEGGNNFVGYDQLTVTTKIVRYRTTQEQGRQYYQIVLGTTPFYPAGGGQVGDQGILKWGEQSIQVINTHRENELIIHTTQALPKHTDRSCKAIVDEHRRKNTASNHSATHLLQAALKQIVGNYVQQRGSLVTAERLRFDFNHHDPISPTTLIAVEREINRKIRDNISVKEIRDIPFDEAKKMGATALFNEKYGATVRVIRFGDDYSIELCGGTHIRATGAIGYCKIVSEKGIAAGIRRIEAITGEAVDKWIHHQEEQMNGIAVLCPGPSTLATVSKLIADKRRIEKEVQKLKKNLLTGEIQLLENQLMQDPIQPTAVASVHIPDKNALKQITFTLKNRYPTMRLILAAQVDQEAVLSIFISDGIEKRGASTLLAALAPYIAAKGGGSATFAFASGKSYQGIAAMLKAAKKILDGYKKN
ncbi:MAG: alanine--tRNA ligase [Bacteroidota bacterium]